ILSNRNAIFGGYIDGSYTLNYSLLGSAGTDVAMFPDNTGKWSMTGGLSLNKFLQLNEGSAPTGASGVDFIWGDSATHRPWANSNNAGAFPLPIEVAAVDLTAQTAAISATTLYSVPASGAGQYRLMWNAKVTTAAGVSSTLGALSIAYTDPDGVSQSVVAGAQSSTGAIETADTGNSTTTKLIGLPMMINAKASTSITFSFAYASNAAAAMNYNLHLKLEAL